MIIAKEKRQSNIAEYILYMWQVEDILRACKLDEEIMEKVVKSRFPEQSEEEMTAILSWYKDLSLMMKEEQKVEKGHLQIIQNTLNDLADYHRQLLSNPQESFYMAAYYKALPHIVELRNRAGEAAKGEIETCFEALYGTLLLRIQKREIGPETAEALRHISTLIALLAEKYKNQDIEE